MEVDWSKRLHDLELCIRNLYEYVRYKNVGESINLGTYFTVILSILMVYGIFLSFLQYAVKEYSSPFWYMGCDLYKEYLFATNQKMWNLVDHKYAVCLCLIGGLPIGAKFAIIAIKSQLWHNILLILWIVVNLFVAGIFANVFVKCARALIRVMGSKEKNILKSEAFAYNNRYMKCCRKMDVDEFAERIGVICKCWSDDKELDCGQYTYNYDSNYLELINRLIVFYGRKRVRNINRIKKGKVNKEEIGIYYNLRREVDALSEICRVIVNKNIELSEFTRFVLKRNILLKNGIVIYSRCITNDTLLEVDKKGLDELIRAYFKIYDYYLENGREHNWKKDGLTQQLYSDFQFLIKFGGGKRFIN